MREKYCKLPPKPKTNNELKVASQTFWVELLHEHINKAAENFTKCLTSCVAAYDGYFQPLQYGYASLHPHFITKTVAFTVTKRPGRQRSER